jgi:hypothetical protein
VQNVQVQAGRPHSGRPALLLRSCPITTEKGASAPAGLRPRHSLRHVHLRWRPTGLASA